MTYGFLLLLLFVRIHKVSIHITLYYFSYRFLQSLLTILIHISYVNDMSYVIYMWLRKVWTMILCVLFFYFSLHSRFLMLLFSLLLCEDLQPFIISEEFFVKRAVLVVNKRNVTRKFETCTQLPKMWPIKERESRHSWSYCGQILFNVASWKNESLRFSY